MAVEDVEGVDGHPEPFNLRKKKAKSQLIDSFLEGLISLWRA